jgi:hypothetical protein
MRLAIGNASVEVSLCHGMDHSGSYATAHDSPHRYWFTPSGSLQNAAKEIESLIEDSVRRFHLSSPLQAIKTPAQSRTAHFGCLLTQVMRRRAVNQ